MCVPRGRRCVCKRQTCDFVASCATIGSDLGIGLEFESCTDGCVPKGACTVCDHVGRNYELCRGHCVPRGTCATLSANSSAACTFCPHCPIELSLVLEMDIESVMQDLVNFTIAFKTDVARMCYVDYSRIIVLDIQSASIEVTFQILGDISPGATTPAEALTILAAALAAGGDEATLGGTAVLPGSLTVLADPSSNDGR